MQEPLLDLSTLTERRPPITIDGKRYHLRAADELSLLDAQRFTSWGKELEALGEAGPEKAAALEALVNVVAAAAVADVPPAVLDTLSPSQKMKLIELFTGLLLRERLRTAGAISKLAIERTGANSSPDSSTPSAEIPATGSPAVPQPS